ncbi:metal ABC transporter ATP-binding protein [Salicibibacter halophilus]|uniref:Metal ABC transporter ATP-binding protein n=1 Tax=Salicibibacter halophilus TaxID=2502791 RepID=A0A514LD63_9BACI|nr:metal ABC transporter ATP-binding protein [Salicibibacter halophilus]QDI89799.1 metal ABC transporter ATP-binding protein [Salicibibacter halophilus]
MDRTQKPVIDIQHITYRYERSPVLDDVSLTVQPGTFLGLVGPNGSGKSTLIRLMLGLLKPQMGDVRLFDTEVRKFSNWGKIGYVSQKANRFNAGFPATVFEVVSMGLFGPVGLCRFLGKKERTRVHEALDTVGMKAYAKQPIGRLSGGQQQRVFIARALVSNPELLILDEPTVGVDANAAQRFYDLLAALNQQHGLTLILVSHDVGTMTRYVSDIACLNQRLHFHGSKSEFEENPDFSALYGHEVQHVVHEHGELTQ